MPKKEHYMDGPRTNLGPILSTPSSAPGAAGSPHEETEVWLAPQHEPRSLSVQPKGRIRKHTQKFKIKRQAGLTETSSLYAAISSSSSCYSSNSNSPSLPEA